jgi:mRNA-degrading endonuclease RelE of RelBE toxin-antitoxin system
VLEALGALAGGAENLDVKALTGQTVWLRLRVGDFRVLYMPAGKQWLVARVVNRRDLDKAVRSLG